MAAAKKTSKPSAYTAAGVDLDLGNRIKRGIHAKVKATHGPEVLGKIGGFGGLFQGSFPGLKKPVLVSSIDGVGTKLKIAFATGRHDTVGQDLVNHCINDIAVIGARPLFFLDYIGAGKLEPTVFKQLLAGLAKACRQGSVALIGGETAQMPGLYQDGEYDLAGCIVGVVEEGRMLDGRNIRPGDRVIGLPSNGLHTNGYSLARKILFDQLHLKPNSRLPGSKRTLADELLKVHRNYQPLMARLPAKSLHGAVHITGGGLIDNPPRILPPDCDLRLAVNRWNIPPIFKFLQKEGGVDPMEMLQVFNMGLGMLLIVPGSRAEKLASDLRGRVVGEIISGTGKVQIG